jgi:GTPase-associated system helical domain
MASHILQTFLDRTLLDLGEGTDKFEYLTKAAQDLSEKLRGDPAALVSATSALLGGEIPPTNATYILCDTALKLQWPTYRSRFISRGDMIFRAALLQAIDTLVRGDSGEKFAAIVYYTATGLLPYLSTRSEAAIFKELYDQCASRVEPAANRLWNPEATSGDLAAVLSSLPTLDVERLTKQLIKVGTPAPSGDNPHAMASAPVEWMSHFGKGVAEVIRVAWLPTYKELVTKLWNGFDQSFTLRAEASRLRSNLLYWKTALYHDGSQQSFRAMKHDYAILHMAYDLHLQVPLLHPKSVEYFLREAVGEAIGAAAAEKKISLQAFCKSVAEDDVRVGLEPTFRLDTRVTPGEAVLLAATRAADPADVVALTALPPTTFSRLELAVEIFRASQVLRLTQVRSGS